MAFMNQKRKAILAAELKKVMPRDWKYTLSVRHHSTIVLSISAAPIDLLAAYNKRVAESWERRGDKYTPSDYVQVNEYHLDGQFSGELLAIFQRIRTALNIGNHDRSDMQTDYFDVGWYVDIQIGKWNKPFRVVAGATVPDAPVVEETPQRDFGHVIMCSDEAALIAAIMERDQFQKTARRSGSFHIVEYQASC